MTADPRVPHLVSLSKRHDIVINLIRNKVSFVPSKVLYEGILNFIIRVRHFFMQNDFIKERKHPHNHSSGQTV